MKKHYGRCAICGKVGELTFEHIPPKNAMNNKEARYITGEEFTKLVTSKERFPWEISGLHYKQLQMGYGKWSLCGSCNTSTGALYGNEYCKIAKDFALYLIKNKSEVEKSSVLHTKIVEFYPLRFIKQVLSMFCSVSEGISSHDSGIRASLLQKDEKINNPKFRIYMFIVKNKQISWKGTTAMYKDDRILLVSEIIAFPFGFIFDHNMNYEDDRLFDITKFLQFNYDDKITTDIELSMLERRMPFPLDFRTKEEVLKLKKEKTK